MPYTSPYTLPIPASKSPSSVGSVANVSRPDVTDSGLFSLAGGASSNFGLRYTGAWLHGPGKVVRPCHRVHLLSLNLESSKLSSSQQDPVSGAVDKRDASSADFQEVLEGV